MKKEIILVIVIVVVIICVFGIHNIINKNDIQVEEQNQLIENTISNENTVSNKDYSSFVGTILEETTTYMIVEPNADEDEIRSADKIMINYGTDHVDYLYGVGRKVVIYYTGYIMETYPAQINTDNISAEGYEDFEIIVKKSSNPQRRRVLNNTDLYKNNSYYDLHYYGLDEVNVKVDNKITPLEEALRSGKITLDGIISKANKDIENKITYKDGGTTEYHYDTYTIIKYHSLDRNRDVYIGDPEMTLEQINRLF